MTKIKVNTYGAIYKITNIINGKVYIGQTTMSFDLRYRKRWWLNVNGHLGSATKKYGHENFFVNKVFDVAFTKEELDQKERYWIAFYNSTDRNFGYNKKDGGANGKHSIETLEKITEANREIAKNKIGKKRPLSVGENVKETKFEVFLSAYDLIYAEKIRSLVEAGYFKKDICEKENISEWVLNKIIEHYKINWTPTSGMRGKTKEQHHNYGKPSPDSAKEKLKQNAINKMEERMSGKVDSIKKMLDEKVSISELSRRYECSSPFMRKVIKHYGLKTNGFNVKKYKIGAENR